MQEALRMFARILAVFIFIYGFGASIREQPVIDDALRLLEGGYSSFNSRLKDQSVRAALKWLCRTYFWAALVCFLLMLIFGRLFTPALALLVDGVFMLTLFAGFSILWWMDHWTVLRTFGWMVGFCVVTPVLIVGLDYLLGTNNFIPYFRTLFHIPLPPFGTQVAPASNPLRAALMLTGILLINFALAYISTWFFTGLMVFGSFVAVVGSVNLAKGIHWINPSKPFVGLMVVVGAVLTYYSFA